ncbi:MAG: hypothetical protein PHU71_06450, partial [Candidatus Gracilibacteria bacterium]|nr:hypothetical protein [Candidatus Gracilibacteria bacterium]
MKNGERLINKIYLEMFREHLATVRDNECLQHLASILLSRLNFASFESCYPSAIEGLIFCRTGAILFKFGSQALHLSLDSREVLGVCPIAIPAYLV